MKTDRLTLLISPADKAAINARAESLGISVSELVRQAALDYDPDEAAAREELEAFMPEFNAMVGSIHASLDRMINTLEEGERRRAAMDTPEYREQVRQELLADPTIDWQALRRLFAPREQAA